MGCASLDHRRRALTVCLAVLLGLSGIGANCATVDGTTAVASYLTTLRLKLADRFFDYDSAKFRNARAYYLRETGEVLVCAEVNGKNRFGGYVGWRQFAAIGASLFFEIEAPSTQAEIEEAALVRVVCSDPARNVAGSPTLVGGDQSALLQAR